MKRLDLPVIPVPETVLARQEAIRFARQCTSLMYGVPPVPYRLESPEYAYFLSILYSA